MKHILMLFALAAITALTVGPAVSASPYASKSPAACDANASCSAAMAEDCSACPPDCDLSSWPCEGTAAKTSR